jgi:hypothetical protein
MQPTSRSIRLIAATVSLVITFTLLLSVTTLFQSSAATQLAKAESAKVIVASARR